MSPSFISAYEGESSYSVMDSGILRHFASLLVRLGVGGEGWVDVFEWEGGRGFEAVHLGEGDPRPLLFPDKFLPRLRPSPFSFVFHYSFALKEQL